MRLIFLTDKSIDFSYRFLQETAAEALDCIDIVLDLAQSGLKHGKRFAGKLGKSLMSYYSVCGISNRSNRQSNEIKASYCSACVCMWVCQVAFNSFSALKEIKQEESCQRHCQSSEESICLPISFGAVPMCYKYQCGTTHYCLSAFVCFMVHAVCQTVCIFDIALTRHRSNKLTHALCT